MSDYKTVQDYPDISFIDNLTLTELKADMRDKYCEAYESATGEAIELNNASQEAMMLDAAALVIYQQILKIDNQGKMNMLKYSTGDWLENLGALKKVSRKAEEAATVTVRFSMAAARLAATGIPEGTRVTAGDGIYFATVEYAEIPIGSTYVDVAAECTTTGTSGNGYAAGEISRFVDAVPFIEAVTNLTVSEGGSAEETDDELRESIYDAPDGYTSGGSIASYKWQCKEYSSLITDVSVYSPTPNNVEIRYILNGGELPGTEMNTRLLEYLNESDRKLLCDQISVMAPTTVSYNVNLKYYIAKSDTTKAAEIEEQVTEAVSEYAAWQKEKIGRDINPSVLIQKVISAGAKRCEITEPVRTVLDAFSLAILNTKTVTYGGLEDD